jgi:NAD-dependent dihydropyrimidine dehydrogenase PreA subunit
MNAAEERTDRGDIQIAGDLCKACGLCILTCPVHCLELSRELNKQGYTAAQYLGHGCTGCGICFYVCPEPGALTVYRRKETRD